MIIVLDFDVFLELAKKENDVVFVLKQTKKNYETGTIQFEVKFSAIYKNQPLVFSLLSNAYSFEDKDLDKYAKDFEKQVDDLIDKASSVINVREGVIL